MSTRTQQTPAPPRAVFRSRHARLVLDRAVVIVLVIGIYQVLHMAGLVTSRYFPPLGDLADGIIRVFLALDSWQALIATASTWLIALAIAVVAGSLLGVAIGSVSWLRELLHPIIQILRTTPPVALIPLLAITLGTGVQSGIFLAAFGGFWFVLVNAIDGVLRVDQVALDTADSYHFGKPRTFVWVDLPSALPYLITGFKLAASICLVLVVTAEILIGIPGLGQQVSFARTADDPPRMYGYIALVGLMGLGVNHLAAWVENVSLRHHPTQHAKEEYAA